MSLQNLGPTHTASLFRPLLAELIGLLRALPGGEWGRPTLAGAWKVRDVAAHLLDGDLRKLAAYRDGHQVPLETPIRTDQDLVRFINSLNASGVAFGARLSHRLLTDLLELTGGWLAEMTEVLPPHEPSLFAVSWAGEAQSQNWMDIGREYTERWHHQMQIRDAIGEPRLLAPRWMDPLLDLSVRALPLAYAHLSASDGTAVALEIRGPTEGTWSVIRQKGVWRVLRGQDPSPNALVRMAADDVWRVFYNAAHSPGLRERIETEGDLNLAQPMLNARSVIV
ncbi:MAG: maleylpyruvate isomerase N-terminal domain-containing protein [Vicinamibacteria bacterium]|nr:maleylpyruvate isomerase N-terminal domain-containing protein [Vicinamibacteria bacterium]